MRAIELLEDRWLGEMIGLPTHRVRINAAAPDEDSEDSLRRMTASPGFYFSAVPAEQPGWSRVLFSSGFELIESGVTLDKARESASSPSAGSSVRFAEPRDEADVCRIAATSFTFSRFHRDTRITPSIADKIKEEWARNYFRGTRGDAMVIALEAGKPAGFMLLLKKADVLVLDLIAVSPELRGQQLAARMIRFADENVSGFARWEVGTQLSNTPSIRLYESAGFRFRSASYIFHCHRS